MQQNKKRKITRTSIDGDLGRQIFDLAEKNTFHRQMHERLSISRGAVRISLKNRDEYEMDSSNRSRLRESQWPELESRLLKWIDLMRIYHKEAVSQTGTTHKGMKIAKETNISDFTGASGWLEKFIRRNSLSSSVVLHGEAASSQAEKYAAEIESIREKLKAYKPCNIYNQDETGLLYRITWKRTYLVSSENKKTMRGKKKQKERVILCSAISSNGTDILPWVMIRKPKQPSCWDTNRYRYATNKPDSFLYYSQSNAWINNALFKQWFLKEFAPHVKRRTGQPVVLIFDNCGGHDVSIKSENVSMISLPPNCTFVHHSLNMGLLVAMKRRYKRYYMFEWFDSLENREELTQTLRYKSLPRGVGGLLHRRKPNISDGARLSVKAWQATTKESVIRCWLKARILPSEHELSLRSIIGEQNEEVEDDLVSQLTCLFSEKVVLVKANANGSKNFMNDPDELIDCSPEALVNSIELDFHLEENYEVLSALCEEELSDGLDIDEDNDMEFEVASRKESMGLIAETPQHQSIYSPIAQVTHAIDEVEKFCEAMAEIDIGETLLFPHRIRNSIRRADESQRRNKRSQTTIHQFFQL